MNETHRPWIEEGYRIFAYEGPLGLKVERLAKGVGKNKSSFYHHFTDLEIFTDALLEHHLGEAKIMAEKEAACTTQDELIEVILEHKLDLLFNRQLRIHRENPDFEKTFCSVTEFSAPVLISLWAKILGLDDNIYFAQLVLKLSLENFFLQITDATLNRNWLTDYLQELKTLVNGFKQTGQQSETKVS